LRTLVPYDLDTIAASVEKTGRCVVVHEATLTLGLRRGTQRAGEENCFYHLEALWCASPAGTRPIRTPQEWDLLPGPARSAAPLRA